jgi:hypothetical protein
LHEWASWSGFGVLHDEWHLKFEFLSYGEISVGDNKAFLLTHLFMEEQWLLINLSSRHLLSFTLRGRPYPYLSHRVFQLGMRTPLQPTKAGRRCLNKRKGIPDK